MLDNLIYKIRLLFYRFRLWWYEFKRDGVRDLESGENRLRAVSADVAEAVRLVRGDGDAKNRAQGEAMLKEIFAEKNDPEAAAQLAALYRGDYDDPMLAFEWYVRVVEAGGWWANYRIAQMLNTFDFDRVFLDGLRIVGDSSHYYFEAVKHGHRPSELRLLELQYRSGEMGPLKYYYRRIPMIVLFPMFIVLDRSGNRMRMV